MHKQIKRYNSKYITYIQAGAELTDANMCSVKDNVGESISAKNPYYCELTAGYWAAKNDKANNFLGLYHYSRGLDLDDEGLTTRLNGDSSVIVAYPYVARYSMMSRMHRTDYEIIRDAVLSINSEYKDAVDEYFSSRYFIPGNIIVASRIVFCEYYDWLMAVIDKCRDLLVNKYKMPVAKRVWGYYGEHLQNIFLLHHKKELNISFARIKSMSE